MAYYRIPTRKEYERNAKMRGIQISYDEMYSDFICDVCGKKLQPGDAYYVVRTDEQVKKDGKPGYRHVMCDEEKHN